jgi:anaerobic magnesium-protoporphyrin IX monomethyl ester cyclase
LLFILLFIVYTLLLSFAVKGLIFAGCLTIWMCALSGWLERFATRVEELDAKVPFKSLNRVDLLLRGDAVNALKRAGAKTIWMGAESGSQKILDAMEKGTRVEQIYEAASRLHAAGIEVGFFLQFGYPGETREDIEMTLQMVRDCKPDDVGMSVSYPLPGTKFHDWVRDQLGVKQNWLDSNDLAMLYKGTYTTDFYRQLHRVLHKEFRARKNRESLTRTLRRPQQVRPQHLRQVAAMTAQLASLPIERRKLNRLEHQPRSGSPQIQIPLVLDPAAASRPSAQPARPEGEQSR